jgi:hypothetical protein
LGKQADPRLGQQVSKLWISAKWNRARFSVPGVWDEVSLQNCRQGIASFKRRANCVRDHPSMAIASSNLSVSQRGSLCLRAFDHWNCEPETFRAARSLDARNPKATRQLASERAKVGQTLGHATPLAHPN